MTTIEQRYAEYIRKCNEVDERSAYFYEWIQEKGDYQKVFWEDRWRAEELARQNRELTKAKKRARDWAQLSRSMMAKIEAEEKIVDIGENLH